MGAERAVDLSTGAFGRFGFPPAAPQTTTPWSPEMARSMAATTAHIEAQRLKEEIEMNTPENRRKAAEAAEAEKAEKRRAWGTRAWALPMDGFKGIHDSAEDKELRIYTRTYDLKHKFWGIKPVGMTIDDFWDIYDPEVTRYSDANQETPASPHDPEVIRYYNAYQETPASPETSTAALPPPDSTQRTKSDAKRRKRQKSPIINPAHRVRKSTKPTAKVNTNTHMSLTKKINSGSLELEDQVQRLKGAAPARGRPARNKAALAAKSQQKATSAGTAVQAKPPSQPKRPRGRPPAKEKSTHKKSKQKKTPAVKGNARVVKASQKEPRPLAPSTHKMRTRRAGPAEPLQLP